MRTYNLQLAAAQPLNVSSNSPFAPLKSIVLYTIAATISGTPNGTLKLQASNDPETNDTQISTLQPTNWVDITGSVFVVNSAGTTMWNIRDIGYNYVRVVYTDASSGSSTATMKIVFNGKGI